VRLVDNESAKLVVRCARGESGDDRHGGPVRVPGADLFAQAVREFLPGRAVADRAQFPSRSGAFLVEAALNEVSQRAAFDQSGAEARDRGGAQAGLDGGLFGGSDTVCVTERVSDRSRPFGEGKELLRWVAVEAQ
jgi:hypothetical protein